MAEGEGFYLSCIANCVFNAFLSYTAIMLNIVTIHALRKTRLLTKPLKILLLSLAVSDLSVGFLVQPSYIADLVFNMQQNPEDNKSDDAMDEAFTIMTNLFCYSSFFGVTALGADRFLAIQLHLRYQELVTHKRVVAVVISIWVFSVFLSFIGIKWIPETVTLNIFVTIEITCILITGLFYYKIHEAVRRHRNHIQALQLQQVAENGKRRNAARLRKSAIGTFYVYLVFLVCYLPQSCLYFVQIGAGKGTFTSHLSLYTGTLVFLNSTLNPLTYCWKIKQVQQAIRNILRNIYHRKKLRKAMVS